MRVAAADVVVVGAGPTGLMLAAELALAHVDVAIIERRASPDLIGSRAGGLHARTIEMLDQRGLAGRFLAQGQTAQVARFAWIPLDIGDFPTRHPYGLALWQTHIERLLAGRVEELGVPIHRGREVTGLTQDESGVTVDLADGGSVRAQYLVGCDGGRSRIRKAAGIGFPGFSATMSCLIAEVAMDDAPAFGVRRDEKGIHALSKLEADGAIRVMVTERNTGTIGAAAEPSLADLKAALVAVYGTDYGVHSPTWISRFTDAARQADAYRDRRVLLAGDAAHIHFPVGGQGLNIGVQDAMNLGWKLARVVAGTAPDSLLDTYHGERHPIAARVLRNTMAQTALLRHDARSEAARDSVTELLTMDAPRKRYAGMISGLDIRYDLGGDHPLVGRRMPDLDLVDAGVALRVFDLLHDGAAVLLDFGAPGGFDATPWADRVTRRTVACHGAWELPVVGRVPAPVTVLIRPDGYVAWAAEQGSAGLADALNLWCGSP